VNDNVYGAVIRTEALREVARFIWWANQLEPQIWLNWQLQYYIHLRHLLLLSSKAETHFTIQQRVEGGADLGEWLLTEIVCSSLSKQVASQHYWRHRLKQRSLLSRYILRRKSCHN